VLAGPIYEELVSLILGAESPRYTDPRVWWAWWNWQQTPYYKAFQPMMQWKLLINFT